MPTKHDDSWSTAFCTRLHDGIVKPQIAPHGKCGETHMGPPSTTRQRRCVVTRERLVLEILRRGRDAVTGKPSLTEKSQDLKSTNPEPRRQLEWKPEVRIPVGRHRRYILAGTG